MKYILVLSLALASLVSALTPDEFKALYERRDKDAEACYALHKAYLEGDGVEKNAAQSHKWVPMSSACPGCAASWARIPSARR